MKVQQYILLVKNYGILFILIGIPMIWIIFSIIGYTPKDGSVQQVHWHIPISYNLCGDTTQLSDSGEHGTLHGHDDGKIHIEGIINTKKRAETLGQFFDAAKIPFSSEGIGKYKNGDVCPGSESPGKLSVLINNKENLEYRDYILNDKDTVQVIFK